MKRCSIVHPKVTQASSHGIIQSNRNTGSNVHDLKFCDPSETIATLGEGNIFSHSEKLYVYEISFETGMSEHEWYPLRMHERFALFVRDIIEEEDLEAIKCPSGSRLFSLNYIGNIPWTFSMQKIAYRYGRYIQFCLGATTPGSPLASEIEEDEYSKGVNPGFFLLPLSPSSKQGCFEVDWVSIDRLLCFGWRCGPIEKRELEGSSLEHNLVCSYHENCDRTYMAGKINKDLRANFHPTGLLDESYDSFNHYFREKHEVHLQDQGQAMLEGYRPRDVMYKLSPSRFMLPPEICRIVPLSPLACFITARLPMWQTFLALREGWRRSRLEEDPIDFILFARALQPNIDSVAREYPDFSYERLEFLGDAILKVVLSMVLFIQNPEDNEGRLSDKRDAIGKNARLANFALEMGIQHCIAFSRFTSKVRCWQWPWGSQQEKDIDISEKVLADCVESLIGAHYLHGGIELATLFIERNKLLVGACDVLQMRIGEAHHTETRNTVAVPLPLMDPEDDRVNADYIANVEDIIQYTFRDKRHLVAALTHGSFEKGKVSYQRYEFLGDAVIGFILLSHFYKAYPNLSVADLNLLRGPALSNDLFARVVVARGIHNNFWHNCPSDQRRDIRNFAQLLADEKDDEDDVSKSMAVPKMLADLFESIIGAIFVDKGMRFDGIQDIILRLMGAELNRFCNPEKLRHNPISQLSQMVQKELKCFPTYNCEEITEGNMKKCIVFVGEKEYGHGLGPTNYVAKRKAALVCIQRFKADHGRNARMGQQKIPS